MSGSLQNEIALLDQYNSDIEKLGERFAEADPQTQKQLQKQLEQKHQIYWKQIQLVKTQFPGAEAGSLHEAAYYTFQALTKLFSSGLMRRVSARSGTTVGIATGLIAKQQEKHNAQQALALLDQALGIFDYPQAHLAKAEIYYRALNQKEGALYELNYIISNFQDDESYLAARQMKDEIENPPKKGMCFIATATYGSPLAPEVLLLSRFRDEVLLSSKPGALFVRFYYFASPPLARLIAKARCLRTATRVLLIKPILRLLKKSSRF